MTTLLSIDPGQNTGAVIGYYDAITPYRLLERYQIHGGAAGFLAWWRREEIAADEVVTESFELRNNTFKADIEPKEIEGVLRVLTEHYESPLVKQTSLQKASLIGYPDSADTADKRQRLRFQFLDRFGLFKAGTENDDSNDAITHALVMLKLRQHAPTLHAFFPDALAGHVNVELVRDALRAVPKEWEGVPTF